MCIRDSSWEVLPKLSASLLKVQLLVYCYSEVYDEELSRQAHSIIATWDNYHNVSGLIIFENYSKTIFVYNMRYFRKILICFCH